MNKLGLLVAGAAGAAAIAVPTAIALAGTPSFNQRIPVRVPSQAGVVSYDDNGRAVERPPSRSTTPTQLPSRTHSSEPGDDNRGRTSRSPEPGDDNGRDVNGGRSSGSDHTGRDDNGGSGSSGRDDNGGSSGNDGSGSGSDNSGRHGGDD